MRKYNYSLLIAIVFLYCALSINLGLCTTFISSSKFFNEVTIDGKWTAQNEWNDAEEVSVYGRSHIKFHKTLIGVFLIKDDSKFLYVMVDFVGDKTLETAKSVKETIWKGNGKDWLLVEDVPYKIEIASTNDAENDPYYGSPHIIYEFAIPREIFGIKEIIGFSAGAADWSSVRGHSYTGSDNYGPHPRQISISTYVHYKKPSTWIELSFATQYEENIPITTTTKLPSNVTTTKSTTSTPLPKSLPSASPSPTITTHESKERTTLQIPGGDLTAIGIIAIILIIAIGLLALRVRK
ncbi:hypothetical protein AC481_03360 [miscellaneous Crenarchaeota group archaeon SMTZ-80]|nr:MAG: hypothetical protein AC481_03360 [miscellaneous Crenarchaeota group archaeon SMTZ-80]